MLKNRITKLEKKHKPTANNIYVVMQDEQDGENVTFWCDGVKRTVTRREWESMQTETSLTIKVVEVGIDFEKI